MRLNMDCVRDILLCVEENTGLRKSCLFVDISPFANDVRRALGDNPMDTEVPKYELPLLDKYGNDTLIYHVEYCVEGDLLKRRKPLSGEAGMMIIMDLTVRGHELLGNIREKNAWEKVKAVLAKAGVFGLDVMFGVANDLAIQSAKSMIGL